MMCEWSSIFITWTSRKIFFKLSWSNWLLSIILTATWFGRNTSKKETRAVHKKEIKSHINKLIASLKHLSSIPAFISSLLDSCKALNRIIIGPKTKENSVHSERSHKLTFASVRKFAWKKYLCFRNAVCGKLDDCKISLSDSFFDIVITDSHDTTMAIVPSRFIRHIRMITCSQKNRIAHGWRNTRGQRAGNCQKTGNL